MTFGENDTTATVEIYGDDDRSIDGPRENHGGAPTGKKISPAPPKVATFRIRWKHDLRRTTAR
jgi:hypothetical protein